MLCPLENRGLVSIIFFILGMGTLLPWNFFITSFDYFNERLHTSPSSNASEPDQTSPYMFDNMCVMLSQLPLLLFTLLNTFFYQHIPERMRIAGSMVFILLLFILTATLVKVKMEQDLFFSITMAIIWFINVFVAVLQGGLFGLLGKFPPKYSSWFMSGQAMSGIFSAVAMLVSKISKTDNESAALGYFITPCAATLLTLCCYSVLPHLTFSEVSLEAGTRDQETKPDLNRNMTLNKVNPTDSDCTGKNMFTDSNGEAFKSLDEAEKQGEKSPVLAVFKKIWVMALCVTCVFTVTLCVFPAITVLVKPNNLFTGIMADIFTPLCCFLLFSLMDWVGRSATYITQWPRKDSCLFPILVAARMIFIPALMFCNIPSRSYPLSFIKHEFFYITIMSLFGMTHGYFACLSMSYAPQFVRSEDAETAGALMTFFLSLGLSLGGAFSFILKKLV